LDGGEVRAEADGIAGQQTKSGDGRVGADIEVGQRRTRRAAALAVFGEALSGDKRGLVGERVATEQIGRERRLQILDRTEAWSPIGGSRS